MIAPNFCVPLVWGKGGVVTRGLAKSGSCEPDADHNPVDLSERKDNGDNDR